MPEARRVLILGGTTEARALADVLHGLPGIAPITALAGRTAAPLLPKGEVRIGGFGGIEGLAAVLAEERPALLVDATHPFAARISANAVAAAGQAGVPLLRLERSPWTAEPGDRWTIVPDLAATAAALPVARSTVFLATGRQGLDAFAARPEHRYILRLVDPPAEDSLPVAAEVILARGPFDQDEEARLFRDRNVDIVVAKNAGGPASHAKIAAARSLGLPVILVARPALPAAPTVATVAEAVERVTAACR
ncbi:MAG: cobalt-precorrin-6A reductase [Azospirillaceae bacterium]